MHSGRVGRASETCQRQNRDATPAIPQRQNGRRSHVGRLSTDSQRSRNRDGRQVQVSSNARTLNNQTVCQMIHIVHGNLKVNTI